MFGSIIELLIDLGLLRADFKHWKKVKKEEEDEGRKKPFKKFFLAPGTIVYGSVVLIIIGICAAFLFFQHKVTYPKQNLEEMAQIENALKSWKTAYGQYPHSILELTKSKPLRKEWLTDRWKRKYYYSVKGNSYVLISAGPDGKYKTPDDIELQQPETLNP